jgi:outer membrane protein
MLNRFAVSALALAIFSLTRSAPILAADLFEVYELARASDPQLAAAESQRLSVGQGVPLARSALLPQLTGSWNKTNSTSESTTFSEELNRDIRPSFDSRDRSYGLDLQQSVYRHSTYMDLKAARAQAARGISDYDAALDALLFRVAEAYFGVLTAQTNLASAEAEEKAVGRQLEQAEQRFEVGLTAITDVHEARARFDGARAAAIQSRNALDDAFEALNELTGKPIEGVKPLKVDLVLSPPEPAQVEAWVDTAIANSPALASRQNLLNAADANVKSAWSGHLPYLSLTGRYSNETSGGDIGFFQSRDPEGHSLTLSLTVPLYSGGATQARYKQAVYDRDASTDQLEQTRRATVRQTRSAYRAVIAGISEVDARKQALVSAQSALEATQAGFEVGTRTIVDVLLSQQQQFAAEREYARARHGFILSNLQLKQSAGTIDVADIQAVNGMLD